MVVILMCQSQVFRTRSISDWSAGRSGSHTTLQSDGSLDLLIAPFREGLLARSEMQKTQI
jgi:hypothetical protein